MAQKTAKKVSYGFYVTLVAMLLSIVAAVVYVVSYQNTPRFMDWNAVYAIAAGVVVTAVLMLVNKELAPVALFLGDLVAFLLYVTALYNYVVVVMIGIDISSFSAEFIASTALIGGSFLLSLVNVFFAQDKKN